MPISGPNSADTETDSGAVVQDTPPDTGQTVLELRTAARFLRTTPDALRKRIQRGKVDAYKEGGQWFVRVDTADRPDRKTSGQRTDSPPGDLYERIVSLTEEATRFRTLCEVSESTRHESEEHYRAQIAELQQEKAALEARLAEAEKPGLWRRLFGGW